MKRLSFVHYAAIGVILISVLMKFVWFNHTGNFKSPIIEYEFVTNQQEVKHIFMENNEFKQEEIKGIRDQNIVDYVFMILYSSLLILTFGKLKKIEKRNFYSIGIVFAILALIGDIIENIELFQISELLINRINFSKPLSILFFITRLKWLSLAFAMLILSVHYFRYKATGKIFAFISALPIITVLAFIIFKDTGNDFVKIFTSSIMLSFIFLIIWVFISKKITGNVNFYKSLNS